MEILQSYVRSINLDGGVPVVESPYFSFSSNVTRTLYLFNESQKDNLEYGQQNPP